MLQQYCPSLTQYKRLATKEVKVGDLLLGNDHPIRIQTMTTTDTMDTEGTVAQCIRSIQAGSELVRITAPSKKEAENLLVIKNELRKRGYNTPLIADIHFTPNAAEIAARLIEKVRINPGNYIDKKKFDFINYTDSAYNQEIDKIRERFTPLVSICKQYGTAMRIGTNHGSLSDRIMSRFGDSPIGMVESAMEFLRIARDENYHQIILSMKSSNPQVMVQAYRLLVQKMDEEFGECYPLHLGVTEAGDGEDGRIKSAIGIGTLLEDGIGDTIRVSLTEDPEFEIPVCRDIVKRYEGRANHSEIPSLGVYPDQLPYNPFSYKRRPTENLVKAGGSHHPVVVADFSNEASIKPEDLYSIGYNYDYKTDKWAIGDAAADFIYLGKHDIDFALPGTLSIVKDHDLIANGTDAIPHYFADQIDLINGNILSFLSLDANISKETSYTILDKISKLQNVIICLSSSNLHKMASIRNFMTAMMVRNINLPVVLVSEHHNNTVDEQLINLSTDTGGLLLDGFGDGIWLKNDLNQIHNEPINGRTYLEVKNNHQFLNNTSFSILQATRTRISKTEYISCPSCGRTLFDLQETTAKIRAATYHLKGVKIAIMGCIVNGPGEMADADFGYVGSGPGKITLYKGKDVMKKNVPSEIAVDELIQLLKENEAWIEPALVTN